MKPVCLQYGSTAYKAELLGLFLQTSFYVVVVSLQIEYETLLWKPMLHLNLAKTEE